MGGFILPQPALGFGGRPLVASPMVLPSRGPEASGTLASMDPVPPEPPVVPPEPPLPPPPAPVVAPAVPALPEVACPPAPDEVDPTPVDVLCAPLVVVADPPAPPDDDPVAPEAPLVPLGFPGEASSEHAAPAAKMMPRRTEPKTFRMGRLLTTRPTQPPSVFLLEWDVRIEDGRGERNRAPKNRAKCAASATV